MINRKIKRRLTSTGTNQTPHKKQGAVCSISYLEGIRALRGVLIRRLPAQLQEHRRVRQEAGRGTESLLGNLGVDPLQGAEANQRVLRVGPEAPLKGCEL